ncbi:MAG: hypothetical protein LBF25_00580 [Puniceicoccales bacterium]|nr:hypothetical protein [Puniceicoccales bacterium]
MLQDLSWYGAGIIWGDFGSDNMLNIAMPRTLKKPSKPKFNAFPAKKKEC